MNNLSRTLFRLAQNDGGESLVNDIKLASFNVVELLTKRLRQQEYDVASLQKHTAELKRLLSSARKLEPSLEKELPPTTQKAAIRIVESIL